MNKIKKTDLYDKFRCIADQCTFTCCADWNIAIDEDTINRWQHNDDWSGYFSRNVKEKKHGKKTEYSIKMNSGKSCPFLNDKGLCNIVISYGDDYLPKTCQTFPRLKNSIGEVDEYSLSCACPAVVDLIHDNNGQIKPDDYNGVDLVMEKPLGYQVRETMISILQNAKYSLKDRMLVIFQMLLTLRDEKSVIDEMAMRQSLLRYHDTEFQGSLIDLWSKIEINQVDSNIEMNELFLDIVQNYSKEKKYKPYLLELYEMAENLDVEDNISKWSDFKIKFSHQDQLMENCLETKIFAGCISDDIDEIIVAFQMNVAEYILVRYSSFLRELSNLHHSSGKTSNLVKGQSHVSEKDNLADYTGTRDFIVIYSRIIGYNSEGMKEFWEESFDEAIWELGYLILLLS